jgi:transcriptional regulator with XRE-family HTH domain
MLGENMKYNTNLGEKIKRRRKELGITQKELAGEKITRNMLSLIENGAAMPSYETAVYLAEALSLPLAYLFSSDNDLFFYEKQDNIKNIRKQFAEKRYLNCLRLLDALSSSDDETDYIYAVCAFEHAKSLVLRGSMLSAEKYLSVAKERCERTVYDTSDIEQYIPVYTAIVLNISAPLLEFDSDEFEKRLEPSFDYEFYKYITQDLEYKFKNTAFGSHLAAKALIKKRSFYEALPILQEVEQIRNTKGYNSYLLFCVYSDLESVYKQLGDFENAYRYSSKMLSMLSGFKI